jgi:hypothetical protein
MTLVLVVLQAVCIAVFIVAFLAARRSRHSFWVFLMGFAFVTIIVSGVLAYIGPLFG